jgi:PTH1 family peptidyl-tRNA hydrolase
LKTPDFLRLRVGVGRPERGDPRPLADYVLSNFEPKDDADTLVARAADAVEQLDAEGIEQAQRAVNRR